MKNLMYPNVFSKYELCLLKRDYPACSASFLCCINNILEIRSK